MSTTKQLVKELQREINKHKREKEADTRDIFSDMLDYYLDSDVKCDEGEFLDNLVKSWRALVSRESVQILEDGSVELIYVNNDPNSPVGYGIEDIFTDTDFDGYDYDEVSTIDTDGNFALEKCIIRPETDTNNDPFDQF